MASKEELIPRNTKNFTYLCRQTVFFFLKNDTELNSNQKMNGSFK